MAMFMGRVSAPPVLPDWVSEGDGFTCGNVRGLEPLALKR
jgi:hypothetical protein